MAQVEEISLKDCAGLTRKELKLLVRVLHSLRPAGPNEVVDFKVDFFNGDITVGDKVYYWKD